MVNLVNIGSWVEQTVKTSFSWAYDFETKKWFEDQTSLKYYGAFLALVLIAILTGLGMLVAFFGIGFLSSFATGATAAALATLGKGLAIAFFAIFLLFIAFILAVSYLLMRVQSHALSRQGLRVQSATLSTWVNFVILEALTAAIVMLSVFNPPGLILLAVTVLSLLLLLVSKWFILLTFLLGFVYFLVVIYNGARLSLALPHWLCVGKGKRDALWSTWQWMGGRTLKVFLAHAAAGFVSGIVVFIITIPLFIVQLVLLAFGGVGSLLGNVLRVLVMPIQFLVQAFSTAKIYVLAADEAKVLGKRAKR